MGDSETVVAHVSTVMDYTSAVCPSRFYMDACTTPVAGIEASSAGPNAMEATFHSNTLSDKSTTDMNYVVQEANYAVDGNKQLHTKEDVNQINPSIQTSFLESNQIVHVTNSNEGLDNCAKDTLPADNGVNTATFEHQLSDGTGERLWSIVKANSADFTSWTLLIDETERTSQDNVTSIRKVYDAFLAEFPLCYCYWKKYADHESRFGATEKVMEVYERAVQGVTYSVEIWLHYCVFVTSTHGDPDRIRRLFERGLAYVGTDYLSYPLWDKYIEYEYTLQQWSRLASIYSRILKNPNQQLDHYFACFKQLVGSQPLSELKTAESVFSPVSYSIANVQGIEGEVQVHSEGFEESSEPLSASLTEVEEKEQYVSIREEAYKRAKEFDSKIVGFETAIRRPYFHVRPLVDAELENWHNYIDFTEKEDDFDKIVKLYERCLIACANYPEYWKRYIMCMENCRRMDIAENALARATQVFVKRQPEIHLFAARFKEQNGDILGARAAYQLVHTEIAPGLLEAIIDHANMERRLGNMEGSFSLYEQAISIEKGKEQSQILPLLYAQYSQFVYLVSGNVDKAREILVDALDEVQMSKPLIEALINLESNQSTAKQIEYLDSLVDKFITPNSSNLNVASATERKELSGIYLEFLGLFGDVLSIKKATDRHNRLFLRNSCSSVSRKRDAEEFLTSEREKLVKSYPAQTHWPVSFESESQTWPHVAQAQEQAWNPSYSQQVSAYPGYYGGNYTHPQVPASVPQASAYGAYPPTYPTQAYPQQAYTTPPAVSAAIPAQQPDGAAQQAYYVTAYY